VTRSLDHPNIVRPFVNFEQENCIVYEYLSGGELYEKCSRFGCVNDSAARKYVSSILYAVKYCHSKNILHGDIKLENFVFENDLPFAELKLIDFDTSRKVAAGRRLKSGLGTPFYSSPEVFAGNCKFFLLIACACFLLIFEIIFRR
jgi:calcium-dependent protein kinase